MYPFRQPANTEDSPPASQEWTPPSYAQASPESSDKSAKGWKPPSYATAAKAPESAHDKAKKNVTFFGSLGKAADETHNRISEFLDSVLKDKSDHPYIKRLLTSQDPSTESILPTRAEAKVKQPETFIGGVKEGLYNELRSLTSPSGAAMILGGGEAPEISPETAAEKLPIRQQSREIPYKNEIPTNQKALPQHTDFIAGDKGILDNRQASPEIKPKIEDKPEAIKAKTTADSLDDYIKQNPTAKMDDIEQFINSMEDTKPPAEESKFVNPFEKTEKKATESDSSLKPSAKFAFHQDDFNGGAMPMYNIEGGDLDKSTVTADTLKEHGIDIPDTPEPVYDDKGRLAKPVRDEQGRIIAPAQTTPEGRVNELIGGKDETIKPKDVTKDDMFKTAAERQGMGTRDWTAPEYAQPATNKLKLEDHPDNPNYAKVPFPVADEATQNSLPSKIDYGTSRLEAVPLKDLTATQDTVTKDIVDWKSKRKQPNIDEVPVGSNTRPPTNIPVVIKDGDKTYLMGGTHEATAAHLRGDKNIQALVYDVKDASKPDLVEMQGDLGGIKPSKRPLEPSSGPYGSALDKLFNSMGDISEKRLEQDKINKIERGRRFAQFSSVDEVGVKGAAQSLSKLKGEFEKVDYDKLKMTPPQVDSLFTAVKRANITPGEKARGYTALFKLFNGESIPARSELAILNDVFGNDFANKITELHGGLGAIGVKVSKLANTMKTMNNMLSLAAPLRHGIGLLARKEFYPAFADMFKFFGNKNYYDSAMQAIEDHPKYLQSREAGLFLPKSASGADEEFLDSYIGDLPKFTGIPMAAAASKRAYTGFLNKLKFDTYNSMTETAKKLGINLFSDQTEKNPIGNASKEAKGIANFINTFTGRGDLGSLNKITKELNLLLWSPRMIASRIQMFTSPKLYTDLPKGMRMEGVKSLLAIAALGTVIDTAAAYGGAKVSTNILGTDFGKSRFGTDLIDPWGGFQQYVVAAARMLAGKTDSPIPTTRMDIAGRFAANKESPAASLAHTLMTAKFTGKSDDPKTAGNLTTEYGQKSSVQREIGDKFTPIFVQDLENLVSSEPNWSENIGLTAAMSAASLAGMAQSYKKPGSTLKMRKMTLR